MRKTQKKIKYYKTPLEPVNVVGSSLFQIKFESKKGAVPRSLAGNFTNKLLAQKAIDAFLTKFQVEYIDG